MAIAFIEYMKLYIEVLMGKGVHELKLRLEMCVCLCSCVSMSKPVKSSKDLDYQ